MIGPTNEVNVQTCPSDLQLKQLLDQSLPKTEFEGIEAHIEHCPICKSKLDRFTQFAGDAWLSLAGSSFPLSGVILEPNRITIPGYEMYEIIGSGSHSVVFKAKEIELDRHVALKLFHANPSRTSLEDRERFRREATVLAKLKHPNIVSVFKTGDFNGRPFIITELIDGGTLAEMIENGIPSDRTTAGLLRDIALGIQTAHENTIIHRDLKPSNVLLGQTTNHKSASGTFAGITVIPKIADFGLAKLISEVENQTETGATFGTPAYMAPELAKTGAKAATPASDIYGLGVIGYELLTGHPPFQGTTHYETLKLACDTDPVSPSLIRPSVPRDLETVILKCLEKNPAKRYGSALDLANDLERFLNGQPVIARPLSLVNNLARKAKSHPRVAWFAVLFIVTVLGSFLGLVGLYKKAITNQVLADRRLKTAREALLTVTKAREQQFWFPQSVEKKDEVPLRKLYDLHAEALPDYRNEPDAWRDTAYALLQISNMLATISNSEDVVERMERGRNSLQELVKTYPNVPEYQHSYAEACMQLSGHLDHKSQVARIFELRQEALSISKELIEQQPRNAKYLISHAAFGEAMGNALANTNQQDEAEKYFVNSINLLKQLVEINKNHYERRWILISTLDMYSRFVLDRYRDPHAYLAIINECRDYCTSNRILAPKRIDGRFFEIKLLMDQAVVQNNLGQIQESRKSLDDLANLIQMCERDFPDYLRVNYLKLDMRFHEIYFVLLNDTSNVERLISTFHEQANLYQSSFPQEPYFDDWPAMALAVLPSSIPTLVDPSQALKIIREKITRNRNTSQTDECLGIILCQAGQYDEAIRVLDGVVQSRREKSGVNISPELFRIKSLWLRGQHDQARVEFHDISKTIQNEIQTTFFNQYFHDELWKMIEGTAPPVRPYSQTKPTGIPLLFKKSTP